MGSREAWHQAKAAHMLAIMWNAETAALVHMAELVMAEQAAEIAQLRAELDNYQGRAVLHCTQAAMGAAALASLDEEDGTILRATDTGRELVLRDHTWLPR
jgi:hypothetical protein